LKWKTLTIQTYHSLTIEFLKIVISAQCEICHAYMYMMY
jgi:hypothetical protein